MPAGGSPALPTSRLRTGREHISVCSSASGAPGPLHTFFLSPTLPTLTHLSGSNFSLLPKRGGPRGPSECLPLPLWDPVTTHDLPLTDTVSIRAIVYW